MGQGPNCGGKEAGRISGGASAGGGRNLIMGVNSSCCATSKLCYH
jgi:hypothetical protein